MSTQKKTSSTTKTSTKTKQVEALNIEVQQPQVMVVLDGKDYTFSGIDTTDEKAMLEAVAREMKVDAGKFDNHVITKAKTGNFLIAPRAVFGI